MSSELDLSPHTDRQRPEDGDVAYQNKKTDMKTLFLKERGVSVFSRLESLLIAFSPSERLLLYGLTVVLAVSALALLSGVSSYVSTTVPTAGGTLIEGEVGPARFINPIMTLSQPDQDLSMLIFSGLMRALPDLPAEASAQAGGTLVPDLASSYSVSDDGTTYTFTLKQNAMFQDGTPVTSTDVLFTVQAIQNPDIKSPHRADWEGVLVSTPDQRTVIFKLPKAYAPFIYDTTLGILPKHLWQNVTAEEFPFTSLNTHPVGSGPYRVASTDTDSTGSVTTYDLVPFKGFTLGAPHLKHIIFKFYSNEADMIKAFNAGKIGAMAGVTPTDLPAITRADDSTILSMPLPRTFGIFFNQNHATVLADASVRAALDTAIDKYALVEKVLAGNGVVLDGPIPPGVIEQNASVSPSTVVASSSSLVENAQNILKRGKWSFDEAGGVWTKGKGKSITTLKFTLVTADQPELVKAANLIAADWKAAGITVDVQVYPLSELNTNVIRPRAYDAILFGEVVGREGDFFAFWHSSQRNDPGLNLALYANSKADSLLANARATTNKKERDRLYAEFAALVKKDNAAIFLFSPNFIYIVPKSIQGISIGTLSTPAGRFLNTYQWYTDTEHVWNIFTNDVTATN
ncbi:MAG: Extracellular solute-binding protein family 5 [Candidatus Kaiserbacteria bacterium GW2011_GWB1_52_6]|uniref:Extracellular solute-binding protein family 5 n=2 Tax=Candidatus Kaiseribacteriota TaxID=1752734 RepID=A0A0G1X8H6_9BACT|nr:MAG: Extracellular solute-binding protein family 5 [Candidatus Kaiserbacteria bacterium GW2011_GWA2_52_12]KKW27543.1 MAG: Extracellular solute-binding protein family 5 [Candidatus Kaiserbacteria bacterium GW2011_GWB1_52_6]